MSIQEQVERARAQRDVIWKLIGKGAQRGQEGFITMADDEPADRARCEWCAMYGMNLDEWEAVLMDRTAG